MQTPNNNGGSGIPRSGGAGQPPARNVPTPSTMHMRRPEDRNTPVHARILWPALGFPAVIAPRPKPGESAMSDSDAAHTLCVLVISDQQYLSNADAARYLRIVPWAQRGRRFIAAGQPGSFAEIDLEVHNDDPKRPLLEDVRDDARSDLATFGADRDGVNGIRATLARRVREIYAPQHLRFLNEIRVNERALSALADGRYQVFWNNQQPTEQAPSDEMALLLQAFARPRRAALGPAWQKHMPYLMSEYEYEFGSTHPEYGRPGAPRTRAEILHPVFIGRRPSSMLNIGQVTDTHVDTRSDAYEENLKQLNDTTPFHNWNKSFVATYAHARNNADILLLTGDLIDYGRGHVGVRARNLLGEDGMYHEDRNWFLFYHLLASGDNYLKPAYTILGNHDWRLNPYPPNAIGGTPKAGTMIRATIPIDDAKGKEFLRKAHGPGHEPKISYDRAVERKYGISARNIVELAKQWAKKALANDHTMNIPGFPTRTTVESVIWYLLTINPFLDYAFVLPAGHRVLMLDWAEAENVFFGDIVDGKRYGSLDAGSGDEGPIARNCLSKLQKRLVEEFTEKSSSGPLERVGLARIIGIHAPPISPWDDWYDDELARGWKTPNPPGTWNRGLMRYVEARNGRETKGHPLFAFGPSKPLIPDASYGMEASWNSFAHEREWFVRQVSNPASCVRLVISGHIHRAGLFTAFRASQAMGPDIAGEMLIRSLPPEAVQFVHAPAVANIQVPTGQRGSGYAPSPLYLTGTSNGPRGHIYKRRDMYRSAEPGYAVVTITNDGVLNRVTFTSTPGVGAVTAAPPPVPRSPVASRVPVGAH